MHIPDKVWFFEMRISLRLPTRGAEKCQGHPGASTPPESTPPAPTPPSPLVSSSRSCLSFASADETKHGLKIT